MTNYKSILHIIIHYILLFITNSTTDTEYCKSFSIKILNIKYRYLQPQNLVLMGAFPTCDVKLCDFEISRVILEGTEIREILGTPDYVGK